MSHIARAPFFALILMWVLGCGGGSSGPSDAGTSDTGPVDTGDADTGNGDDRTATERFSESSTEPVVVNETDGVVWALSGRIPLDSSGDAESRARGFLDDYGDLFGLEDPNSQLEVDNILVTPSNKEVVIFGQYVDGVPVYSAELRIHIAGSNEVIAVTSAIVRDVEVDMTPVLSDTDAVDQAIVELELQDAEDVATVSTELVVFNRGLFDGLTTQSRLAWVVELDVGDPPGDPVAIVDASSGVVVDTFDEFSDILDREIYSADHFTNKTFIIQNGRKLLYTELGPEAGASPAAGCFDEGLALYEAAEETYHYFFSNLNRDSYDDQGSLISAYGCFRMPTYRGAHWDGNRNAIWFARGMVALDVFAHEFTHGVIRNSDAKLRYMGESGALNESFADVFGELIAPGDETWRMGEDTVVGPIRNLRDPGIHGHPSHMDDSREVPSSGACTLDEHCNQTWPAACLDADGRCTRTEACWQTPGKETCEGGMCRTRPNKCHNDRNWVHFNSGIPNHVAYLIFRNDGQFRVAADVVTEAGAGQPLDRTAAAQIYYLALTEYIGPTTNFERMAVVMRQACLEIAVDWPRQGRENFDVDTIDCGVVVNAFAEVGIGPPDADYDAVPDPYDNCARVYNPDQADADFSRVGDACEGPSAECGNGDCESGETCFTCRADCANHDLIYSSCYAPPQCPAVYSGSSGTEWALTSAWVPERNGPAFGQRCDYRRSEDSPLSINFLMGWVEVAEWASEPWCEPIYSDPDHSVSDADRWVGVAWGSQYCDPLRPPGRPCDPASEEDAEEAALFAVDLISLIAERGLECSAGP